VPQERLRRFFQRGVGDNEGSAMARPELRSLITYRTLNLLHNWPMRGPFDVIFCRNVMIYFDQATREKLVGRFGEMLAPGGYLCIGHSESIHAGTAPFKLVGKTIYRRHGGDHAG
jgi:chemotaxis protein methyltransferase CheR